MVRAQVALLRAQLIVRFGKRGTLLSAVNTGTDTPFSLTPRDATAPDGQSIPSPGSAPEIPPRLLRARELAVAVRRVADHGLFRAHCLARALATRHLMQHEGLANAEIRVGVAMRDKRLIAHAWVEYGGTALVESATEVQDLSEVEGLRVSPVA